MGRAGTKRGVSDIQTPPKSGGTLSLKATDSSLKKESATKKISGGVDMGELSKLLGTTDIMKDISSTKKPTQDSLSARRGLIGTKPSGPASEKIKEGE